MDLSKLKRGVVRQRDWSVDDVLDRLDIEHAGVGAAGEISFNCVAHEDENPSASINSQSGLWFCHGCGEKGNIRRLITMVLDHDDALELISQLPDFGRSGAVHKTTALEIAPIGPFEPAPSTSEEYSYTDEKGELLYQVLRGPERKRFSQRRPDGTGGWIYNLTQTRVPYRLPEVIEARDAGEPIFICEGEKDVHALEAAGFVATCNSGGAGKWPVEFGLWYFTGATVVIVGDRDQKGIEHALDVEAKLKGFASETLIVLPAHGKDAADHFYNGGTLHDLIPYSKLDGDSQSQPFKANESGSNSRRLVGGWYSDVAMKPLTWLFDGWIPDNSLSLFAGDGGIGKSTFLVGLAAILSNGSDTKVNSGVPAATIILSSEDPTDSVMKPRLVAAGADLDKVAYYFIQNESWQESLTFPRDFDLLSEAIVQTRARLVILDPGNGHLDVENAHADVDMRRALGPLSGLAAQHGCAIIYLIHLNKNKGGSTFRERIIGSVGSVNAARSVLGMARHPENAEQIVLAHAKHNYSAAQKSLLFRMEEVRLATSEGAIKTTRMVKIGDTDLTADDLVAPKKRGNPKLDSAMAFIEEALSDGPVLSGPFNAACGAAGISKGTLSEAKNRLGVVSKRIDGAWHVAFEESL